MVSAVFTSRTKGRPSDRAAVMTPESQRRIWALLEEIAGLMTLPDHPAAPSSPADRQESPETVLQRTDRLCAQHDIQLTEIAALLGVTPTTMAGWRHGRFKPAARHIRALHVLAKSDSAHVWAQLEQIRGTEVRDRRSKRR